MRAFLGIEFKPEIKQELLDWQQNYRKESLSGRWKHSDNFHLTLKFFADLTPGQKELVDQEIGEVCTSLSPFSLRCSDTGIFKGRESIRVLWAGLAGDVSALQHLFQSTEKALAGLGFPMEQRKFQPHITLGQDIKLTGSFEQIRSNIGPNQSSPIYVDRLFLFKSEQIGPKRVYTKVSEYRFAGKP